MSTLYESLQVLKTSNVPYFVLDKQKENRLQIIESWLELAKSSKHDLESHIIGAHTLDIGCGQGDMTEACAALLKTQGDQSSKVTGVDPASLDYGELINVLLSKLTF
jgi:2-polyprenyl-3-methyl-5-hydroxy-6-metoxy-1,4-benzoquinol methylase